MNIEDHPTPPATSSPPVDAALQSQMERTMMYKTFLSALTLTLFTTGLAGCGGGGGETAPAADGTPPPTPSPPTAITGSGLVSKFGPNFSSITVGGQEFDTTGANLSVTVDGQPSTIRELRVGNRVDVRGSSNGDNTSASATSITQRDDLKGPISAGSIDLTNQIFVVLGQTVQVSGSTLFDDSISPASLEGLSDGDVVEVSGLSDADGVIVATRVELQNNGSLFEVYGVVSALDSAAATFRINDLTVDYSGAALRDLPGGMLANGLLVEVKGMTIDANGVFIATEVDGENEGFDGDNGDLAEIEGYITRFASPADFDIAGRPVSTTAQTVYERGSEADLALNVRLEAEGDLDANGVLVARKIEFKVGDDQADVEISARVDSVDAAQNRIVVLGITVNIVPNTRMEDDSDAELESFNIGDLNPGDYVEMRGFEDPIGSRNVTAVRLEREDADDEVELQGAVESVNRPMLSILGVTINTYASTEFEGLNDERLSADQFFTRVSPGQLVKAEGQSNGNAIDAEEVEFED